MEARKYKSSADCMVPAAVYGLDVIKEGTIIEHILLQDKDHFLFGTHIYMFIYVLVCMRLDCVWSYTHILCRQEHGRMRHTLGT
jgi:hypothetical protein